MIACKNLASISIKPIGYENYKPNPTFIPCFGLFIFLLACGLGGLKYCGTWQSEFDDEICEISHTFGTRYRIKIYDQAMIDLLMKNRTSQLIRKEIWKLNTINYLADYKGNRFQSDSHLDVDIDLKSERIIINGKYFKKIKGNAVTAFFDF